MTVDPSPSRSFAPSEPRTTRRRRFVPSSLVVAVVVASSFPFASATNPDSAPHLRCDHPCGPHGTCRPQSSSPADSPSSSSTSAPSSASLPTSTTYECVCDDGWSGPDCLSPYVVCDDKKRRCYNNSECRRNERPDPTTGEYGYRCDCTLAFGVSAFAGRECENSATSYCEQTVLVSPTAFCTNGGKCRSYVLTGEDHPGCDCPPEFEGEHCQYLAGTGEAEVWEEEEGGHGYEESHRSGEEGVGMGNVARGLGVFAGLAVFAGFLIWQCADESGMCSGGGRSCPKLPKWKYDELFATERDYTAEDGEGRNGKAGRDAAAPVAASMRLDPDGSSTMPRPPPADAEHVEDTVGGTMMRRIEGILDGVKYRSIRASLALGIIEEDDGGNGHSTAAAEADAMGDAKKATRTASFMYLDPDGSSTMPRPQSNDAQDAEGVNGAENSDERSNGGGAKAKVAMRVQQFVEGTKKRYERIVSPEVVVREEEMMVAEDDDEDVERLSRMNAAKQQQSDGVERRQEEDEAEFSSAAQSSARTGTTETRATPASSLYLEPDGSSTMTPPLRPTSAAI